MIINLESRSQDFSAETLDLVHEASLTNVNYLMSRTQQSSHYAHVAVPDLTDEIDQSNCKYRGGGHYGDVYSCLYKSDGGIKEVAVKTFRLVCTMDDEDKERGRTFRMSRRELGIWRRLSHPNIVEFLGTISGFKQKGGVSIVSAWMHNGTLQEFLLESKDQLTSTRRLELVLDIASGLDYLHSLHIVHGDLSSANVLINSKLKACLADFGYSSLLGEMPQGFSYLQATMARPGTARWTAPELLEETTPMTTKSDIYSFGNLALLVLSGNQPWPRCKLDVAIIRGMDKGLKPGNPETHPMDDRYWELVEPCWLEVADRPPTKEIVLSIQQFLGIPSVQKEALRIDTPSMSPPLDIPRRHSDPLDISATKRESSAPLLSALVTARKIERLQDIEYPEGVRSPREDLNKGAKDGKFRYDRDFLMQFMSLCREEPPNLPPLDTLGIVAVDQTSIGEPRGGSSQHRQSSVGLGLTLGFGPNAGAALELVAPLEISADRWVASKTVREVGASETGFPELVDRKVRSLLDQLTVEKFDSISDQIIVWANKSISEKDGRTLIQVIRLIFENAKDQAAWSEMYARLCRKMMETISPDVQDDGIKTSEGKPIAGGQLFRKYLLIRCQEEFERDWVAREATAAAAAAKVSDDQAIQAANEKKGDGSEPYSDEYYAAQTAKRLSLGLIKFIGELFKLQMLTERIMHECVKKLLKNEGNPEEEEIESLCQLLTAVGQLLDTPKAKAHMDVYFTRMKEICKSLNVSPRMQFMLRDVIKLHDRKWVALTSSMKA